MAPHTTPTANALRADAKAYEAPGLTALGEIAHLTAGPEGVNLDLLTGDDAGGFIPPDPAS